MECGDCQHGTAAIRLSTADLEALGLDRRTGDFFTIKPAQSQRESEGFPSAVFSMDSAGNFSAMPGSLTGIWKKKMCVNLAPENKRQRRDAVNVTVRGSPVAVEDGDANVATGVVTHVVDTDGVPQYSVSRFDENFHGFVGAWLEATWETDTCTRNTSKLYSKFDCYPPYPTAYLNESLCLCSRGWTNEK